MHVSFQVSFRAEKAKLIEGGGLPSRDCSKRGTDIKPTVVETSHESNLQPVLPQYLKYLKWEANILVVTKLFIAIQQL